MVSAEDRHDFINNSLRLEILNKLLCEQLEKKEQLDPEMLKDLRPTLEKHLEILERLQSPL